MAMSTLPPKWFRFLGNPRDSKDVAWIMSDDRKLHTTPLVGRNPLTILPGFGEGDRGVRSFDPAYLKFLRKLVEGLDSELPVDLDPKTKFVGPTAIQASFETLKTVAGYSMAPMSLAVNNNEHFVDSLGLPTGTFRSARHAAIFDRFAKLVLSRWKPTSVKTPKMSTSGAPIWKTSALMKREHAMFLLANDNRVLALWAKRDMVGLASLAKVVFMMNAGRRDQVDEVGKTRWVFPLEYAESGGLEGEPIAADKRVVIDGEVWDGFSATRARLFKGGPYATNMYAQIIATGTMHGGMFDQFGPTFHCTDVPAALEEIGPEEELICSDATEYDRSMATFLIKRLFAIAREFWSPELIDWCEHLCWCACFSRPVGLDPKDPSNRPVLIGDPWSPDDQIYGGNPSGHAWTSFIAKFMMVFDWLATVDDLMGDVLEDMEAYLNHKKPLKTRNNGDDGMYYGEARVMQQYIAYRFNEKSNPGYFVLRPEVGQVWSGYLCYRKPDGWFTAYPRLHTPFSKMLCPERSAGSNFRPHFTVGILQRVLESTHPMHGAAMEIFFRTWKDYAAPTYGPFMELIMAHHERLEVQTEALTRIDMEVLDKPELLFYKYTERDVSPVVLSMLFERALSIEEVLPFVESHYKGEISRYDAKHEADIWHKQIKTTSLAAISKAKEGAQASARLVLAA